MNNFFLRTSAARVAILTVFHAIAFTGCYALAVLLRFDFHVPKNWVPVALTSLPIVVGVQLLVGALFKFYRGWWRYVGITDVLRLVFGLTTAFAILLGLWYADAVSMFRPPRSVLVIDWAFAILTLFGTRVLIRVGRDRMRSARPSATRNVLIIGAGDAGEALAREIEHRPQLGMRVAAFVDDHRAKWGSHIRGIVVRGPISNIEAISDETESAEALLAIPSASGKRIREIIHHLSSAELRFTTIPGIDQLVSGEVHVSELRPVNVEDLLRRARVDLPGDPVRALVTGRRVLVTGAGGTIGSELASQILRFEPEALHLVERSEYALYEAGRRLTAEHPELASRLRNHLADINDEPTMTKVIAGARPHIVLHAAAHKHVPLGEQNPPEYLRNNCFGTRAVAEICAGHGVERFVLISTDKAINPTNVMGATKRAAEIAILDLARRTSMKVNVVRFGNVIGSSGSVIPLFMQQIAAGGPITVTHPDVTRYFLRTSEAVSLVLQAVTLPEHGRVLMLDMGEPVKIAELARDLIRLSNKTEDDVEIKFTGLRPGEKLYEEVRMRGEHVHETNHPQIVVTEAPQPHAQAVAHWLVRAERAYHNGSAAVVAALHEFIPEYKPDPVTAQTPEPVRPRTLTPPPIPIRQQPQHEV
jgi:FlaA1/EpsC-like NDP-sugar epimerase